MIWVVTIRRDEIIRSSKFRVIRALAGLDTVVVVGGWVGERGSSNLVAEDLAGEWSLVRLVPNNHRHHLPRGAIRLSPASTQHLPRPESGSHIFLV